jgi:SAM-dependent methyltransferase
MSCDVALGGGCISTVVAVTSGAAPNERGRTFRALIPSRIKALMRPLARRAGLAVEQPWWLANKRPRATPDVKARREAAWCNICRWAGTKFAGTAHSESAVCPQCGSIARDRFLFAAFMRMRPRRGLRVLETSPRLGGEYRTMMRRWFAYRCSDYDLGAHQADIALDLQDIDLPEHSIDVLITPHVLEHVPDTKRALAEIHRVLAPNGRMYLQVPLLQGATGKPLEPEFHEDNTPVHWRFGWDLTQSLRNAGFATDVLVTPSFKQMLTEPTSSERLGGEFDLSSICSLAPRGDLHEMLPQTLARQLGLVPDFQFVVWECKKPG